MDIDTNWLRKAQAAEHAYYERRRRNLFTWAYRTRTAAMIAVVNPFTPPAKAARLVRLLDEANRLAERMPTPRDILIQPFDSIHHLLAAELNGSV